MAGNEKFAAIFARLKKLLQNYEKKLLVRANDSLDAPRSEKFKRELFFGAVRIKKNHVSHYLSFASLFAIPPPENEILRLKAEAA